MASTSNGKKDPLPSTRENSPPKTAYTGDVATIEVGTGPAKRTFYAHCDLLSFYSGYFQAALNGGFAEAQNKVIKLETEEPAVFAEFVLWLYTQKAREEEITAEKCRNHFTSVMNLWIFADRRVVPLLMNEMVDRLQQSFAKVYKYPGCDTVEKAYGDTTAGSPLRRMIVDMFARTGGELLGKSMLEESGLYSDFPMQFLFDLSATLFLC